MIQTRSWLTICGVGLLVALLLAGCTLPAAPDVTPTPSEQEAIEAGMAQMATEAAQTAAVVMESPVSTPTPLPTPVPSPTPPPTPVPTIAPTVPPTAPPPPQPTEAPPMSGEQTYIVQRGDTLYSIARRYGVRLGDLAAYNGIVNPNRIYVGQVLRIPSGPSPQPPSGGETVYIVQPGDRLFRIALRYNMNYLYLAAYNGIANPNLIYPGQVIRIPPSP